MVDALERHPAIRLALHYSGPLLEWLRAERPEFIDRLRALVERGQVEILGGGYYEPVLASLPGARPDRPARRAWPTRSRRLFGRRPTGAWLAERVWEPDVPTSLVDGRLRLDDPRRRPLPRRRASPRTRLWGPYTTEDQGRLLTVFGTEQGLRYRIPFREVDEVIELPRASTPREAGDRVGDDGRRRREVRRVADDVGALLGRRAAGSSGSSRRSRRTPTGSTTDDPVARGSRRTRRSGASTSRPARTPRWANGRSRRKRACAFAAALHHARRDGRAGGALAARRVLAQLPGEVPRDQRPPQADAAVSAKVDAMPAGPDRDAALDQLYRGQSNDCYWHGLFGGIYIAHMRARDATST